MKLNKGFTLIELLVVIAILAVLMVVVVITLNPSELLKQSRDSNRLSDMATIKSAISLYQTDVATTSALGTTDMCYASIAPAGACASGVQFNSITASSTGNRTIGAAGWLPLNFNLISFGTPMSQLPVDPLNTATNAYFYAFEASGTSLFKLTMKPESVKFQFNGSGDVSSKDGGMSSTTYETGPGAGIL